MGGRYGKFLFLRGFVEVGSCLFIRCNVIVRSFTCSLVLHVLFVSRVMEHMHKRASNHSHEGRGRWFFWCRELTFILFIGGRLVGSLVPSKE